MQASLSQTCLTEHLHFMCMFMADYRISVSLHVYGGLSVFHLLVYSVSDWRYMLDTDLTKYTYMALTSSSPRYMLDASSLV
jgi:hypothetical protein